MSGGGSVVGAIVPSVKSEAPPEASERPGPSAPPPVSQEPPTTNFAVVAAEGNKNDREAAEEAAVTVVDKDALCRICMQMIKEAFSTSCGHNFCYMCITTHLQNKSDCPCCGRNLTANQLVPNFLLNKLLMKASAQQIAQGVSPIEQFRQALQQGCDVSVKELDSLLILLTEKKRKMEREEAETNLQIMHEFLHCLRRKKLEELNEIQNDLQYIKEDINAVERHKIELNRAREKYQVKLRLLTDGSTVRAWWTVMEKNNMCMTPPRVSVEGQCWMGGGSSRNRAPGVQVPVSSQAIQRKDECNGSESQNTLQEATAVKKRRVHVQLNDLQECYLQKRRYWARQASKHKEKDDNPVQREGYHAGLKDFQSVLSSFTQYSRLQVIVELRHGDLFHSANIISSIEFDRDDELFAIAGVSRSIKVFEFASVVNEHGDMQCPIAEMSTRSKLSCLSWNKYIKNHLASSDYDGIVTIWDVTTHQSLVEYEEHEKRTWSLDFSCTEPTMLVSGSDDCKVGSADHHIHYYDLRNLRQPLHVFSGHRKAVSYVKFLSDYELVSASTDSTLRLWDVKQNVPLRVFRGHTNDKNFVGLTVNNEYLACGSETNEVFIYHKAIPRHVASHGFSSDTNNEGEEEPGAHFTSAVCWKSDSPTMLTANSRGTIRVLTLTA